LLLIRCGIKMVQGMVDYKICPHNPFYSHMCSCLTKEERKYFLFRFHENQSECKNPDHQKFGNNNVFYLAQLPTWKDSCFVPLTEKKDQEYLDKICQVLNLVCACDNSFLPCKLCHYLSNSDCPSQLHVSNFERWSLKELVKLFSYIDWEIIQLESVINNFSQLFVSSNENTTVNEKN